MNARGAKARSRRWARPPAVVGRRAGTARRVVPGPAVALAALALAVLVLPAGRAEAQERTRVMVRAVAQDAKVIGSGVGGARITVRDAATGEVLAEGVQEGSTGSTEAIMLTPRLRGLTAYAADSEAAGFLAELHLERPTRIEIAAEGPLNSPHAMQRASRTLLVVPGRDVLGEGVILELYGFTVELLSPAVEGRQGEPVAPETGAIPVDAGVIPVRARVTMLCGCPTEPGGMWDADQIEVAARLLLDGEVVAETELAFSGETSVFAGELPDPGPGPAALEVIAADPGRANFGMVRRAIEISDEAEGGADEAADGLDGLSRTGPPARPRSPRTRP